MYFPVYAGFLRRHVGDVKAVDDVSFDIHEGETLGIVGESGCGKSTCGRAVLRLYELTAGSVHVDGVDIGKLSANALRRTRPTMQMVFQDPQACLNPRMTVSGIIGEPLDEHTDWSKGRKLERIYELMDAVGLNRNFANRYPHEFSGGQRQRIAIGRAVATRPEFIVADEPVSALDVTIQAQILDLLLALVEKHNLTMLFISHDLSVVRRIADRVLVMNGGKILEQGKTERLWQQPAHAYTKALLAAIPRPPTIAQVEYQ